MLFSTPFFLFVFLPVFFVLYWFLSARRILLLLGSIVFYGWSEPLFIFVVFGSTGLDWILGKCIFALPPGHRAGKALVAVGVVSNVGLLGYVKYAGFAAANLDALLGYDALRVPQIALPLGISFIVFEKITYLVDVYRRVARPAASLLDYANYVLLFPKLLAGPIVKYHDIAAQLTRPSHRYEDVRDGLIRFIQGLAKKTILADTLGPVADQVFLLPAAALDAGTAWLGLVCFALQIYFDFSGYSDMAIGLGRILGFRLMENFNNPYLATSFTDFWRRWHISLSTWIKEYVYIPLGGNRVSTARSYANLCLCFLLSGLWHGASWNFVLWGSVHGVMLVADRAFWLRLQKALPRALNVALTLWLVTLTWVFFRCTTFSQTVTFLRALAGARASEGNSVVPTGDVLAALAVCLIIVFLPLLEGRRFLAARTQPAATRLAALGFATVLFFAAIARLTVSAFHPFIYFRF
jgi:alginate O-acetyltransferase complex protein AlgI